MLRQSSLTNDSLVSKEMVTENSRVTVNSEGVADDNKLVYINYNISSFDKCKNINDLTVILYYNHNTSATSTYAS